MPTFQDRRSAPRGRPRLPALWASALLLALACGAKGTVFPGAGPPAAPTRAPGAALAVGGQAAGGERAADERPADGGPLVDDRGAAVDDGAEAADDGAAEADDGAGEADDGAGAERPAGGDQRAARRPGGFRKAVLIPFQGEIHPLSEHFLYRKLDEAEQQGADLVIVEFDSPGGHLQSSLNMAEKLRFLPWAYTVAYIPREAYSGAAIAALGCDEILMGPDAQFGDAAPIFQGRDSLFRHAPEKIRSVLVSQVRDLAEARGRPPALAQAMVDMDVTVYRMTHKRTGEVRFMSQQEVDAEGAAEQWEKGPPVLETQGKLFLTINGRRAVELQMAEATVGSREELQRHFGLEQPIEVLKTGVIDTAVYLLNRPFVTFLLFLVGLVALYLELSAPGISIGGLIAGLCFALFFWSRFLGGTSTWLEIVLFAAGVIFLAVELFVLPGFGVSGVLGILMMVVSLLMASQDFVIPSTPRELTRLGTSVGVMVGSAVAFIVAVALLSRHFKSLPVFNKLILPPPVEMAATGDAAVWEGKAAAAGGNGGPAGGMRGGAQVGDWGVAASPLRPAGKAQFGEEYLDVVADGLFVDAGRQVRITKIQGNRIVVREVDSQG